MTTPVHQRILMLLENCSYPADGRVRREAVALTQAGYRVSVIAPADRGQASREIVDGVHVYRYKTRAATSGYLGYLEEYGYSLFATFFLSLAALRREGVDVVHAHCPPDTFVLVGLFYKLLGKRFVYDHHDLAPEMYYARFGGEGNRFVFRVLVWFEQLACKLADQVITTNQSYKTMEIQRDHLPESRITIVRNGPELDKLPCVEADAALGARGKTVIGYIGVVGSQDGVDYLLRGLKSLLRDLNRDDFFCVVVGDGDALPGLKMLALELGLTDYVQFTGWVEHADLGRYAQVMDICVAPEPSNPYNDRSTMIKIMDYMALAKPIVAFDLPEHRRTADGAALFVRPNEESELARSLAQLMDDPARRKSMGSCGRRRVETELSWQYSVPNLLSAYHKVWNGKS